MGRVYADFADTNALGGANQSDQTSLGGDAWHLRSHLGGETSGLPGCEMLSIRWMLDYYLWLRHPMKIRL